MAAVAGQTPGRIGAAVLLIETGEHAAWHGRGRFPMQSVYKFPIAMAVLRDVDRGKLALDQPVRIDAAEMVPSTLHSPIRDSHPGGTAMTLAEVLRYAVTESDGTASDVLLRLVGGPARVTAYLEELGVRGVRVVTTEREMSLSEPVQYRNWAQPEEVVALLRLFWQGRGLSAASRARLLEWMTVTGTGPKRIRGLLPQGAPVAHKTGTSNTSHGLTPATNDVGIVTLPDGRHLAIAVFVADSPAGTEAREAAIARIARAAWDWALEQR
ncbi:MAG: class A beta-lactamase [Acidobacteria bacterium]|nr:class A beta-lactamase [Acidobacteriota bacterium]